MNLRQVHLDFHTSEKVKNIGENFTKENFQKALKEGHVNSITVFSKCHHGWSYHPSKTNEMHPELKFDLLKEQIEAAHEIGVKTPVYLSAGLDEKDAVKHHDWLARNKDQSIMRTPDFETPGYHIICFNTPYLDILLKQIKEVCENYDADGIFLDIVGVKACYCENCRNQLIKEGKDPFDEKAALELGERVYANYTKRVRETIDSVKPGLPVFHNAGHINCGRRDRAFMNTHLEVESLPTGGWGYDNFPLTAAYVRTLDMDFLGMTGKFHTSWGEFGGFKHPNALKYEAVLSFANGAGCSVGDQCHPDGMLEPATYKLIGNAYKFLEEREEYFCKDFFADIGVISNEAMSEAVLEGFEVSHDSDAGFARMLLEGHYLFNVVDAEGDFSPYKVIILPDSIEITPKIEKPLKEFVKNGGKILATGKSGLKNGKFAFDFGCEFDGLNENNPCYFRPCFEIDEYENTAFVMYSDNYKLENVTGEVVGLRENSYFNRTVEHFCSHQHTPNDKSQTYPATVIGKDGAYIGWEVFKEYAENGSFIVKKLVLSVLERLVENRSLTVENLPSQGVCTMAKQKEKNRIVVNLLFANPIKRGKGIEIIEDIIPISGVKVKVKTDKKIKRAYLAPENKEIEFTQNQNEVHVENININCMQILVLEY